MAVAVVETTIVSGVVNRERVMVGVNSVMSIDSVDDTVFVKLSVTCSVKNTLDVMLAVRDMASVSTIKDRSRNETLAVANAVRLSGMISVEMRDESMSISVAVVTVVGAVTVVKASETRKLAVSSSEMVLVRLCVTVKVCGRLLVSKVVVKRGSSKVEKVVVRKKVETKVKMVVVRVVTVDVEEVVSVVSRVSVKRTVSSWVKVSDMVVVTRVFEKEDTVQVLMLVVLTVMVSTQVVVLTTKASDVKQQTQS